MDTCQHACFILLAFCTIFVVPMPYEDQVPAETYTDTRQNFIVDHRKSADRSKSEDKDTFLLLEAGGGKKEESNDDEEEKTLSQQIADGKYGLIQKEIYPTAPDRPGIISYESNPEVPNDTEENLGGLHTNEIWLSENHVLVLSGGKFPDYKPNITESPTTIWPPIDDFEAPERQVKIPSHPKVPPPFPIQLKEGGPTQIITPNGTAIPVPGNSSYFAPPFPPPLFFPSPENFSGDFPFPFPTNFTKGEFFPPPINGSFIPPPFQFPFPPQKNGSFFIPPFPGNVSTGNGPYPPPFPGLPFPLPPRNGSLPFFPPLPPGAALLPPPENLTDLYDEDDPSIYYPPPYDFYYPTDNTTQVPPGPLVPGIILPPPPNFFAPLVNTTRKDKPTIKPTTKRPGTYRTRITTTTKAPPKKPVLEYLPPTRHKKPRPPQTEVPEISINEITPTAPPDIVPLTTPNPLNTFRPIDPSKVEITHGGQSPLGAALSPNNPDELTYINLVTPPTQPYITPAYDSIIYPTPITYQVSPVTDILVNPKPPARPSRVKTPKNTTPKPQIYYSVQPQQYVPKSATYQKPIYVLEYQSEPDINVPYNNQPQKPPSTYYLPTGQVLSNTGIESPRRPQQHKPQYQGSVTSTPPSNPTTKTSYYFYEEPQIGNAYISDTVPRRPAPRPVEYYDQVQHQQPYYNNNNGKIDISQLTPEERYILSQIILSGRAGYIFNKPRTTPPPKFYYTTNRPQFNNPVPKYYVPQEPFYPTPRPSVNHPSSQRPYYEGYSANIQSTRQNMAVPLPQQAYNAPQTILAYNNGYFSPISYQSTPKPILYTASTSRPNIGPQYSTDKPQYLAEEVTIGSSTTNYNLKQYEQSPKSQTTRPKQSQITNYDEVTSNPLDTHFTKQDETFLDDITKKYFTIFGQKLQPNESKTLSKSTTPIPSEEKHGGAHRTLSKDVFSNTVTQRTRYDSSKSIENTRQPSAVSLDKDIAVNYKEPLPPINPESEYVVPINTPTGSAGSLITYQLPGNGNGHVYFITPQVVSSPQQSQNGYVYATPPEQRRLHYRRNRKRNSR